MAKHLADCFHRFHYCRLQKKGFIDKFHRQTLFNVPKWLAGKTKSISDELTCEGVDVPVSESRDDLPLELVTVVHRHQVFAGPDDCHKLVGVFAGHLAGHLDADSAATHHDYVGGLHNAHCIS